MSEEAGSIDLAALTAALNRLWDRAGQPGLRVVAKRTRGPVSHSTVGAMLNGVNFSRWSSYAAVVRALGGNLDEFQNLWLGAGGAESLPAPPAANPGDRCYRERTEAINSLAAAIVELADVIRALGPVTEQGSDR